MARDPKVRRLRPVAAGGARAERSENELLWDGLAEAPTVEAFAPSYLELQCRLIEGTTQGVLVLGPPDRGPFELAASWPEDRPPAPALLDGAQKAVERRKPLVANALPEGEAPSAERRALVAWPIELAGKLHGAVVIEVESRPEAELRKLLERLRWGAGWLDSLQRRSGKASSSRRARVELVPDLLATALEHEGFEGAARAFVTELATGLGCDRVSVGFRRGKKTQLRAISHSSHRGKKTNLIRAIEAAMDEAIDQQQSIVHPPPAGAPPVGTHAHQDLERVHEVGAVCSVPIVHAGRTVGAITLERAAEKPFDAPTVHLCEVAASLVGPLLDVMRRDDRWLFGKALDAGARAARKLFGPRYVARKLVVAGLLLFLLFVSLVRGEFRVTADTVLEPALLRATVAPFPGYVGEAPVRAGDLVQQGQLLATLDDRDLSLERAKWVSQEQQLIKQYRQAMAVRDASRVEIFAASIEEARAELARIDERLARSRLAAPFDGVVISGDLTQHLGAPVDKGDVLFEVAPLDAYRVILKVDETDVSFVEEGRQGRIVFASLPHESFAFTVFKVTPVATAEEGQNFFRVEASLESAPERLRPAMEGVAKIEIDRRPLIWIWTHDGVEWLRLALWRWLP